MFTPKSVEAKIGKIVKLIVIPNAPALVRVKTTANPSLAIAEIPMITGNDLVLIDEITTERNNAEIEDEAIRRIAIVSRVKSIRKVVSIQLPASSIMALQITIATDVNMNAAFTMAFDSLIFSSEILFAKNR
jgi:uncharacterized membrane protein